MANIKVGANTGDFQKQMKAMVTQLKEVNSEFTLSATKAKLYGSEQDKLKIKQQELTSKVKLQNEQIKLQSNYTKKLTDDLVKNRSKNMELHDSIDKVNSKLQESIKTTGKNSDETKALEKELDGLKKQLNGNEKQFDTTNNKLDTNKTKLNNMKTALMENEKALKDVNKALSTVKLDEFAKKTDNIVSKLKPFAIGIAGAGVASGKMAMDFEDSMAKVFTIADKTEVSYDDMKKAIMDLSNQTGISAKDIANNVYDAISAGQKTGDAVNFVTDSTKLAKAGFAEAGQSLDLLTTILNGYKLKAEDATKVSDILITTQNLGKVTVGELSESMGKIIKTADVSSVSLEQVASGYALMTSNGIKSAETTTYMSSMLNEMSKSGTVASKALKNATGKTFQQLTKEGKTLGEILNTMSGAAKKNGKSLADMFGSAEAGKAALILAENGGKDFNGMLEQMNKSAGATTTAFDIVNDTTGNKMKVAFNKGTNAVRGLGDILLPIAAMGFDAISKVTDAFNGLSDSQKKFIVGAGGLVVGTTIGLSGISKLSKGISTTIDGFTKFKEIGGKAITTIGDLGSKAIDGAKHVGKFALTCGKTLVNGVVGGAKAIGNMTLSLGKMTIEFIKSTIEIGKNVIVWTAHKAATIASTIATKAMELAQVALNFVMSLNPIAKVVIIIGALAAAFVTAYNKCDWFREKVDNSMQKIKNSMQSLKDKWDYVMEKISSAWEWVKSKFKLPHFNITGSFSLNPPSIPKVAVDWYWRGGIIDEPTILGNIGVGDKFEGMGRNAEAIVPLDSMYRNIDAIVNKRVKQSQQVIYVLVDNTIDINGKAIKALSKETLSKIKQGINKEQQNNLIGRGVAIA